MLSTSCGAGRAPARENLPAQIYLDLIGAPYVAGGRGPGYDCLGLAIEIQRRRGIKVPDFVSCEGELHRQLASGGFLHNCIKLNKPEPGCAVLLDMRAEGYHLGTMVSTFRMIHTQAQTRGAVIESILGPLWERRILGFYSLEAK